MHNTNWANPVPLTQHEATQHKLTVHTTSRLRLRALVGMSKRKINNYCFWYLCYLRIWNAYIIILYQRLYWNAVCMCIYNYFNVIFANVDPSVSTSASCAAQNDIWNASASAKNRRLQLDTMPATKIISPLSMEYIRWQTWQFSLPIPHNPPKSSKSEDSKVAVMLKCVRAMKGSNTEI
jgi:hypothetical protein